MTADAIMKGDETAVPEQGGSQQARGDQGTAQPVVDRTAMEMEDREVRVSDPGLSISANERLTEQVQDVIGTDHVTVTRDRPHPSRGERIASDQRPSAGTSTNLVLIITALMFLVVGALLTALTGSWWFSGFAVVADVLGGAIVIAMVLQMTGIREHADATTVALLEAEGVHNPDELFSRLVTEFTEQHRQDTTESEQRVTAVEDDPVKASAEQAAAGTPSGGRSEAVGPGAGNLGF